MGSVLALAGGFGREWCGVAEYGVDDHLVLSGDNFVSGLQGGPDDCGFAPNDGRHAASVTLYAGGIECSQVSVNRFADIAVERIN